MNCVFCNKQIETYHPTKRFCDNICKRNYDNQITRKHPIPSERENRKCIGCNNFFIPNRINKPHQKFCSAKCRFSYNMKEYRKKHRIDINQKEVQLRKMNPKYYKKIEKKYYEKNREKVIAEKLAYRKTPYGKKVYHNCARRYSLKRDRLLDGTKLSTQEILYIEERDNYQCVYCERKDRLSLDHIIPIVNGGKDSINNVVIACIPCNASKKQTPVEIWCSSRKIKVPKIILELLNK